MKKSGAILGLQNIKATMEKETKTEEITKLTSLAIIELLLTYINDPQIREETEKIPF